jgi:hypothetical protein
MNTEMMNTHQGAADWSQIALAGVVRLIALR